MISSPRGAAFFVGGLKVLQDYDFTEIELKWREIWQKKRIFEVEIDENREKYYVLEMFPIPLGAACRPC